jgi:hypothetical protein
MPDERTPVDGAAPNPAPACPWCSAPLPSAAEERCPSCFASLHESATAELPGLTRVDHEALLRRKAPVQPARGLIGWLSGEYRPSDPPVPPGTFAPPDDEVRREMLRLELAALEAEVHAREAEAAAYAVAVAAAAAASGDEPGEMGRDADPEAGDTLTTTAGGAAASEAPPGA